jgi:hypothetical protein
MKVQEAVAFAGFAAVMVLIVAVLFVDATRFLTPKEPGTVKAAPKEAHTAP